MRRLLILPLLAMLAACGKSDDRTELVVQRFFGSCQAEFGKLDDPSKADGECGIITALINQFEKENPDIKVVENTVFWPGYDQLTSQLAANGAPDLVTMHSSAISDYEARGLLEPLNGILGDAGISPDSFTASSRAGVMVGEQVMGLPIDVWAPLWHINMNLFSKAGLVKDGRPILPTSPEEFDHQARQFRERTGKPYFIQVTDKDFAGAMRIFYIYVMQQGGQLFLDENRSNFNTPEGRNALNFMRQIYERGHSVKNHDYASAISTFLKGEGGLLVDGTWMVGQFTAAAARSDSPLSNGYAVTPYPQIFKGRTISLVDGHNWVMPRDESRTDEERKAAGRFMKFFADNNFQWARTGHFPAYRSIIESEEWRSLTHRKDLAILTEIGEPLPRFVRRQAPIEVIVGEEASAAFHGHKPVDRALEDMQRRANEILQSF